MTNDHTPALLAESTRVLASGVSRVRHGALGKGDNSFPFISSWPAKGLGTLCVISHTSTHLHFYLPLAESTGVWASGVRHGARRRERRAQNPNPVGVLRVWLPDAGCPNFLTLPQLPHPCLVGLRRLLGSGHAKAAHTSSHTPPTAPHLPRRAASPATLTGTTPLALSGCGCLIRTCQGCR